MDIVDHLSADHGYLTTLARRIVDELPRFVRGRPQAIQRLRDLVSTYAAYDANVHQPKENCLRSYLDDAAATAASSENASSLGQHWHDLCQRLAKPLDELSRLDLRHRLFALIRDSKAQMQQEEDELLDWARSDLSRRERHALAMRMLSQA